MVPLSKFNNGDPKTQITLKVYDWNKSGKSDFIGQASTTLADLLKGGEKTFQLINPKKASKKKYFFFLFSFFYSFILFFKELTGT